MVPTAEEALQGAERVIAYLSRQIEMHSRMIRQVQEAANDIRRREDRECGNAAKLKEEAS